MTRFLEIVFQYASDYISPIIISLVILYATKNVIKYYSLKFIPKKAENIVKITDIIETKDKGCSIPRVRSYRIEEELLEQQKLGSSGEVAVRGQQWFQRPIWRLNSAKRENVLQFTHLEATLNILEKYDIDPNRGFLPNTDPLQRLPYSRYHLWEDLGDDLPKLLGARLGQAREPLRQLPVIELDSSLKTPELRRAHLLLSLFAHAYIWGGKV